MTNQEQMNIVIVGHVDHGKSTIIGRLLADTDSLPDGKIEQIRKLCELNSKPFEYAFLIDALKDERGQGITIDSARVFFQTPKRDYIIIDAPGHIEFLKNMVTGASRAEAALLVIDAEKGIQENSRRHGYMLSLLGIQQVGVLVTKMDLVNYRKEAFRGIVKNYRLFLEKIGVKASDFIPISGRKGDNIASPGSNMPWYQGETVLTVLDRFKKEAPHFDQPFRMPVQDVYRFSARGDKRRLVVGTVATGSIQPGEEVVFYPSGKKSRVQTIEDFPPTGRQTIGAGEAAALTLDEQIYIIRGEIATRADESQPKVTTRLSVSLFWMGRKPMVSGKDYLLKVGTTRVPVQLEKIIRVINASDLSSADNKIDIGRHEVAECILKTSRAVAFDLTNEIIPTSRFVIVEDYEICGGGVIRKDLEDQQQLVRDHVLLRNYKWETSLIPSRQRSEKYNQNPVLILITGKKDSGKKSIAKALEEKLFTDGKFVYFLGIGNILYGVDADIKESGKIGDRSEHLRRLAEVANILLEAGLILVVTAIEFIQADRTLIETTIGPGKTILVWVGEEITTDVVYDIQIKDPFSCSQASQRIKTLMQDKNIIFCP